MDVHGTMLAQVTMLEDTAVAALAWSCPKFKMDEADSGGKDGGGGEEAKKKARKPEGEEGEEGRP